MANPKTQTPKIIAADSAPIHDRAVPLSANAFRVAEYCRTAYVATIPVGTTIADICDPSYWSHVASSFAQQLKPTDHIECVWEDFSQYAELLVIRPTRVSASVAILSTIDLRAGSADIDLGTELSNYLIRFAGSTVGYRIIYKPDNTVLKDSGLPTEATAKTWLIAHLSDGSKSPERARAVGAPEVRKADEVA